MHKFEMDNEQIFDFGKKKKRAAKAPAGPAAPQQDPQLRFHSPPSFEEGSENLTPQTEDSKEDTNSLYEYDNLLDRLFDNLNDSIHINQQIQLEIPKMHVEGPRKTRWLNFQSYPKKMDRDPEHLRAFVQAEFACNSFWDSENRLILLGRFASKHAEVLLRHYLRDYVNCQSCKSVKTVVFKERKDNFMKCEDCGSTKCMPPIRTGVRAVTKTDRKLQREKI